MFLSYWSSPFCVNNSGSKSPNNKIKNIFEIKTHRKHIHHRKSHARRRWPATTQRRPSTMLLIFLSPPTKFYMRAIFLLLPDCNFRFNFPFVSRFHSPVFLYLSIHNVPMFWFLNDFSQFIPLSIHYILVRELVTFVVRCTKCLARVNGTLFWLLFCQFDYSVFSWTALNVY